MPWVPFDDALVHLADDMEEQIPAAFRSSGEGCLLTGIAVVGGASLRRVLTALDAAVLHPDALIVPGCGGVYLPQPLECHPTTTSTEAVCCDVALRDGLHCDDPAVLVDLERERPLMRRTAAECHILRLAAMQTLQRLPWLQDDLVVLAAQQRLLPPRLLALLRRSAEVVDSPRRRRVHRREVQRLVGANTSVLQACHDPSS